MKEWPALGIAVLITPLVPGTTLALVSGSMTGAWPLIAGGYVMSLPMTAIVGLPVFLVLRQLKWL
jgi:hypothetical protein